MNSPPLVEAVAVVPQTPTTTDPLSCETNDVRDADADPVMLTYAWFADGRDLNINAAILPAGSLVRGQKATCRVTPNDGEEDGMFKASSAVTLRNTPPSIKAVSVVPASAHTDEALACVPEEATDADDDPVSFRYSWSINGEAVGVRGARLAPNLTRRGDVVSCAVRGFDGVVLGDEVSHIASPVRNSPPRNGRVRLSSDSVYATSSVQCVTADFIDPDGDPIEYTFDWFVNDVKTSGTGRMWQGGSRQATD